MIMMDDGMSHMKKDAGQVESDSSVGKSLVGIVVVALGGLGVVQINRFNWWRSPLYGLAFDACLFLTVSTLNSPVISTFLTFLTFLTFNLTKPSKVP